LKFMRDQKLSNSTKAAAFAGPACMAASSRPREGHHSGAEKVFGDITRLSGRTGYPRGGGKC
jgi:hypothetical protein